MFGWKTVGVKKFNLEKVPKQDEIKDIISSYSWLESTALSILTRYSYVGRELGKGGFGSAFLLHGPKEIGMNSQYVVKVELGHLERFPVWEAMVGAYLFAPQKDVEWRKKNRVPLVDPKNILAESQKKELKVGDPFLHIADYYGVVTVNHSNLEDFVKKIAKEAPGEFTYKERGWESILNRAEQYILSGLNSEGKKLWQATEFAKKHPMVFSIMEYFEEGNIWDYLLRSTFSFSEKMHIMRVAFFQIIETLKVLSKQLGFSHGDTHAGNVFVRTLPSGSYSKMWYKTDDPTKSYRIITPPKGGVSFALGDLGLNELFDYPEQHYFSLPIRSPRHDLHLLSTSFLMLLSEIAKKEEISPLPKEFVDLVRDLEGFMVSSEEYDVLTPTSGPFYTKEKIKRFLQVAPKIDAFVEKGKVDDYPSAFIVFSKFTEARSFDVDLGEVSEEIYEKQNNFAKKIAEIVDTPDVPFDGPEKTKKEFWKNVGKSSGEVFEF